MMRWLAQQWRRLTEEQRRAWIAAAEQVLSRLRLEQGPLTGAMLFIKLNFVLWLAGREFLVWPTPRVVLGPNPVGELMIRREHGQLRLKLRVCGPVAEDILVYGEAAMSAGRKKPRHPVFLCLLPAARDGWSDITERYVARFGVPAVGKKVIICTRQQRDGWQDRYAQVSGAVVPARLAGTPRRTRRKITRYPKPGWSAGAGFKGLNELLGIREFHGLELNELLGLSGLEEWPRFPLPAPGRPPGRQPGTTALPRNHYGSTPMCTVQPSDIAALYTNTPRRPSMARFPLPITLHASRSTLHAPRLSPLNPNLNPNPALNPNLNPNLALNLGRLGPVPGHGRMPGKRRKCHWRALWRGT